MKAEELMIGDWVMVNRSECVADDGHYFEWQEVGRIVGLQEGIITMRYSDHEETDTIDWAEESEDDVKPYLLTKEIMEKNGIKYQFGLVWYQYGDLDSEGFEVHLAEHCQMQLRYVHELQHALRLCGIEKEIEL